MPETQREGEAAVLELVVQGWYRRPLAVWPQRPKQMAGQSPAKSKSEGNGCPNYFLPGLTAALTTRVLSPIPKEFWSLKKIVRKLSEIFGNNLWNTYRHIHKSSHRTRANVEVSASQKMTSQIHPPQGLLQSSRRSQTLWMRLGLQETRFQ